MSPLKIYRGPQKERIVFQLSSMLNLRGVPTFKSVWITFFGKLNLSHIPQGKKTDKDGRRACVFHMCFTCTVHVFWMYFPCTLHVPLMCFAYLFYFAGISLRCKYVASILHFYFADTLHVLSIHLACTLHVLCMLFCMYPCTLHVLDMYCEIKEK